MAASNGFMYNLSMAACEWFLMFLMFIDAALGFILKKFAHHCELQPPCLFCTRLDHVFSNENPGSYLSLFCYQHRAQISCLISCDLHEKLVDVRELCDDCFMSIMNRNRCNHGSYKGKTGMKGFQKPFLNRNLVRGPSVSGTCSCCNRHWKGKPSSRRVIQPCPAGTDTVTMKPPLPRIAGHSRYRRRNVFKRGRGRVSGASTPCHVENSLGVDMDLDSDMDAFSDFGYADRYNSDSESEFSFYEEDDTSKPEVLWRKTDSGVDSCGEKGDSGVDSCARNGDSGVDSCSRKGDSVDDSCVRKGDSSVRKGDSRDDSCIRKGESLVDSCVGKGDYGVDSSFRKDDSREDSSSRKGDSGDDFCVRKGDSGVDSFVRKGDSGDDSFVRKGDSLDDSCVVIEDSGDDSCVGKGDSGVDSFAKKGDSLDDSCVTKRDSRDDSCVGTADSGIDSFVRKGDDSGDQAEPSSSIQENHSRAISAPIRPQDFKTTHDQTKLSLFNEVKENGWIHDNSSEKSDGYESPGDGSSVSEIIKGKEGIVEKLKRQVEEDQQRLHLLHRELEEERNASAIAADEAMAMITRLQEEKASLHMEALQYLRMMDEQAEYDMEALDKANDLVAEKDKEIQDLEAELEFFRSRYEEDELIQNPQEEDEKKYILESLSELEKKFQQFSMVNGNDMNGERVKKEDENGIQLRHSLEFIQEIAHHLHDLQTCRFDRRCQSVS